MAHNSLLNSEAVKEFLEPIRAEHEGVFEEISPRCVAVSGRTKQHYKREIVRISVDNENRISIRPKRYALEIGLENKIKAQLESTDLPINKPWPGDKPPELPFDEHIKYWELRNLKDEIVAYQTLVITPSGDKIYNLYSYWGNDVGWIRREPLLKLPLYIPSGLNALKSARIAFIHEGAKTAYYAQQIADKKIAHPWYEFLKQGLHVGWVGGAFVPWKSDWSMLKNVESCYIIPDNDLPGTQAVPSISRNLRCPTYQIVFDDSFPKGFDIADPWPKKLTEPVQPTELISPATWLDDIVGGTPKRKVTAIRESTIKTWAYIEGIGCFVCPEVPNFKIPLNKAKNSRYLAPYCFSKRSIESISMSDSRPIDAIDYFPGDNRKRIGKRLNTWQPSCIQPNNSDIDIFKQFMEFMFPIKQERKEFIRWFCTLIARPKIRMGYGILLITRQHGIGKTTIGDHILAPILGEHNVSFPRSNDFKSDFNYWCVQKQLAFVNEIYEGHGWSVYHKLKSIITDKFITANEKHIPQYTMNNKCHIIACSNSDRALKIESSDRRWFIPQVTEAYWGIPKYKMLYDWLQKGPGLGAIVQYALDFESKHGGKFIHPGEHSPSTGIKDEIVIGSRSAAVIESIRIGAKLDEIQEPKILFPIDLMNHLRTGNTRVFESMRELMATIVENTALLENGPSMMYNGIKQTPIINLYAKNYLDKDGQFIPGWQAFVLENPDGLFDADTPL